MSETASNHQLDIMDVDSPFIFKAQTNSTLDDCPLCTEPSLQILINNALYHKYLDNQYTKCLTYVEDIMDDEICPQAIKYRQMVVADDDQEFMRRMYSQSEYEYKNKAIVQYYKFHKDYPKIHIKGVSKLMERFHDRKKQFQYKKIKRILKEQQNISITTQKSSQIFSDIQQDDKKSHYSNVLVDLTQSSYLFNEQSNESQVWKNMCKKIGIAFQNKPLSPINFKKKSIFDQPQIKQAAQTKNFVNYLKKQQQKKDKEEKYKNFTRSNKESKYNSIQHTQSKQYTSGISVDSNYMKKVVKRQKSKPLNSFKGSSAFYDGKMFYNPNNKANTISKSKDQKTKQQSNTPSQQNLEFDFYYAQNGFKKNKDNNNAGEGFLNQKESHKNRTDTINLENFKSKTNIKTTQEIYKNATQDMKLKKRSISYNSLANTNISSKRTSTVNILVLKQKDFEIRNRASSQGGKLLKQRHGLNNQLNLRPNIQNQTKIQRTRSSGNFRTSRSVPKFYQADLPQAQNKTGQNLTKKISIPKQVIQSLKGKSFSASKLKAAQGKYSTSSRQTSGDQVDALTHKLQTKNQVTKQRKNDINLYIENGLKDRSQPKDIYYGHHSVNNINIQKLLSAKLMGKGEAQKPRQHKILI